MSRRELEMWVIGFMRGKSRSEALAYIAEMQRIDPAEFWNLAERYIRIAYRDE